MRAAGVLLAIMIGCGGDGSSENIDAASSSFDSSPQCEAREYMFVFAGQSNMQGENSDRMTSTNPAPGTGREYLAASNSYRDITSGADYEGLQTGEWHLSLARAKTGSLIPAFVSQWNAATGNSVLAVSTARGGAGIYYDIGLDHWQPSSQLMVDAKSKIDAALVSSGATIDAVIYLGGESDVAVAKGVNFVEADFKEGVRKMIREFDTSYDAPVLFILPSHINPAEPNGDAATVVVRESIRAVTEEAEFAGKAAVIFDGNLNYRDMGFVGGDHVHYNQAGLNTLGTEAAAGAASYFGC